MKENTKSFTFDKQLSVGDKGERDFLKYYKKFKPKKSLELERDFVLSNGKTVELKTDTYDMDKTPNFFIEVYGCISSRKLGGVFRAKRDNVDYFVYYYPKNKTFFWFKVVDMYDVAKNLIISGKYKAKTIKNASWTTQGYAIPRKEFEKAELAKHVFPKEKI